MAMALQSGWRWSGCGAYLDAKERTHKNFAEDVRGLERLIVWE
jgi:hypothetical protein